MFDKYQQIYYPFIDKNGDEFYKIIRDITTNIRIRIEALNLVQLYEYYNIREGDTPEIIAAKYYGDSKLHYLVILANDRFDWRNDYPLTSQEFEEYIRDSYVNPNGIHHYETPNGKIVSPSEGEQVIPVTNYEYEYRLNESKRKIRLINKKYTNQIVELLRDL